MGVFLPGALVAHNTTDHLAGVGAEADLDVAVGAGARVLDELHHVPHVQRHVHDQLGVVLASLGSSGHADETILRTLEIEAQRSCPDELP